VVGKCCGCQRHKHHFCWSIDVIATVVSAIAMGTSTVGKTLWVPLQLVMM